MAHRVVRRNEVDGTTAFHSSSLVGSELGRALLFCTTGDGEGPCTARALGTSAEREPGGAQGRRQNLVGTKYLAPGGGDPALRAWRSCTPGGQGTWAEWAGTSVTRTMLQAAWCLVLSSALVGELGTLS